MKRRLPHSFYEDDRKPTKKLKKELFLRFFFDQPGNFENNNNNNNLGTTQKPPRRFLRAKRKKKNETFGFPFSGITPREDKPIVIEIIALEDSDLEQPPISPCHEEALDPIIEEPVPFRVYAFLTKFEPGPEGNFTDVIFECVGAAWFDEKAAMDDDEFWENHADFASPRLQFFHLPCIYRDTSQIPVDLSPVKYDAGLVEDTWYRLRVSYEQEENSLRGEATEFHSVDDPPVPIWLMEIDTDIEEGVLNALQSKFSIKEPPVEGHRGAINQTLGFVAALDIGQGGCNALFNADGNPFLYYDVGRARDGAERPPGGARTVCMRNNATVVLSHWDEDHYELALDYEPIHDVPWLVTHATANGVLGPGGGKVSKRLSHFRFWPARKRSFEEYDWGFIVKADGDLFANTDLKNLTCLILLVRVQDDPAAPPVGQRRAYDDEGARPEIFDLERYVILSGDAMLHFIPSCREGDLNGKVVGIVAPHHGAQTHMTGDDTAKAWHAIPEPAPELFNGMPPLVVYTYGINNLDAVRQYGGYNQYGHPGIGAVQMYARRGYHLRLNTVTRTGSAGNNYADHRNCVVASRLQGAAFAPGSAEARAAAKAAADYFAVRNGAAHAAAHNRYQAEVFAFGAAANSGGGNYGTVAWTAYQLAPTYGALLLAVRQAYQNGPRVNANNAGTKQLALDALLVSLNEAAAELDVTVEELQALAKIVADTAPQRPAPQTWRCGAAGALGLLPAAAGTDPVTAMANPPATVANVVADNVNDAAFNNENIVLVATAANQVVIRDVGHGLNTNDHVSLGAAPGAVAAGAYQITKLDNDHYSIGAVANLPVVGPALVGTRIVTLFETAPGRDVVVLANHGYNDGDVVALNRGTGAVDHRLWRLGQDHFAVAAAAAGATRVRAGHVGGQTVTIITSSNNETVVCHPRHSLVHGTHVAVRYASAGQFAGANFDVAGVEYQMALLDDDHYAIDYDPQGVDFDAGAAVAGTPVRLISTAANTALVRHPRHGIGNGNNTTISGSTLAACNGVRAITKIDAHHYRIAGPNAQNNAVDRSALAGAAAVTLLESAPDVILVRHPGHGNPVNPAFAGGLLDGRTEAVTVIDVDHYTVPLEGAELIYDGTVTVNAQAALLLKTPAGECLIHEAGHGYNNGQNLAFVNSIVNGQNLALTKHNNDWYRVTAANVDEVVVATNVTAGGNNVTLVKSSPGTFVVRLVNHGLASGTVAAFVNGVVDQRNYAITKINADYFSIPLTPESGGYLDDQTQANAAAVDVIKSAPDQVVVRHANHGINTGANVTFSLGPLAGRTFAITKLHADYYAVAAADAPLATVTAGTIGMNNVSVVHSGLEAVLVTANGHGLRNGDSVIVAGSAAGANDGEHTIHRLDNNHYTFPTARRRTLVDGGARVGGRTVLLMGVAIANRIVRHPNHGIANNDNVTIANAADNNLNQAHAITRINRDHYWVPGGGNANACDVDPGANASGTRNGTRDANANALAGAAAVAQPGNHAVLIGKKSKAFCTGNAGAKLARVVAAPNEYNTQLAMCKVNTDKCTIGDCNVLGAVTRGAVHKL